MNTSIEHVVSELKSLGKNLGIIATTNTTPEAAVVYFTYDEYLNIYFTTRKDSRKYANIMTNPHAAFVIYNAELFKTIQIEGTVTVIENAREQGEHYSELVDLVAKDNPLPPIDQLGESEILFMRLETTWARVGDFEISRAGDMFQEVTQ